MENPYRRSRLRPYIRLAGVLGFVSILWGCTAGGGPEAASPSEAAPPAATGQPNFNPDVYSLSYIPNRTPTFSCEEDGHEKGWSILLVDNSEAFSGLIGMAKPGKDSHVLEDGATISAAENDDTVTVTPLYGETYTFNRSERTDDVQAFLTPQGHWLKAYVQDISGHPHNPYLGIEMSCQKEFSDDPLTERR